MRLIAHRLVYAGLFGLISINMASGADSERLMDQPGTDFAARRRELIKIVKEAEAKRPNLAAMMRGVEGARKDGGGTGLASEPIIVLLGEPGGVEGKFRQENDFAYLTGVDVPDAALILSADGGATLYLPPRNPVSERWNGKVIGPGDETAKLLGFSKVESTELFLADLFRAVSDPRKRTRRAKPMSLYMVAPEGRAGTPAKESEFVKFVRQGAPNTPVRDVATLIHTLRPIKTEAEVALLRKAIAITGDAQAEVIKTITPGIPEYVLEGAILGAFTKGGSERLGFPSIVGSGPNSCIMHYMANRRTIEDGDLVVVDIGAEFLNYTADITRTYPANGKFTPRQSEIYQLVLDAQTGAADQFKLGETSQPILHRWVKAFFKASPVRAKDSEGVEQTMDHFFTHGLGHALGMDVHDVGDSSQACKPGEVFTIEPGLYIPSESLGVRIEDDYLVKSDGTLEKLSKAIPSDRETIERLIAEAHLSATKAVSRP